MKAQKYNTPDDHVTARAAELIRLIFDRVGTTSPAGYALRCALGFARRPEAQAAAAKKFGCTIGALRELQTGLERSLGRLALASALEPEGAVGNACGESCVGVDSGTLLHKRQVALDLAFSIMTESQLEQWLEEWREHRFLAPPVNPIQDGDTAVLPRYPMNRGSLGR